VKLNKIVVYERSVIIFASISKLARYDRFALRSNFSTLTVLHRNLKSFEKTITITCLMLMLT